MLSEFFIYIKNSEILSVIASFIDDYCNKRIRTEFFIKQIANDYKNWLKCSFLKEKFDDKNKQKYMHV